MQTPWINNEMGEINSQKKNRVMRFSIKKALLGYISDMKDDLEKAEAVIEEKFLDHSEQTTGAEQEIPTDKEEIQTSRKAVSVAEKDRARGRTQPDLSSADEIAQQERLSAEVISENETEQQSSFSNHKAKTIFAAQDFSQESANNHKKSLLARDFSTSESETAFQSVHVRIPVILGNYQVEICLEDEEVIKEKIKEIRNIANQVELTKCQFTPMKLSPILHDGFCQALSGHLLLEGVIKQDITYLMEKKHTPNYVLNPLTSNLIHLQKHHFGAYQPYLGKNHHSSVGAPFNQSRLSEQLQHSISKTIPFSSMIKIEHFLHSPFVGSVDKNSLLLPIAPDKKQEKTDSATIHFSTTTYYPDTIDGELIHSKINDTINLEKKYKKIKLKQYIVLELSVQLIQEQSIQLQASANEFILPPSY